MTEVIPNAASLAFIQSRITNPKIKPSKAHHKEVMTVLVASFLSKEEKNNLTTQSLQSTMKSSIEISLLLYEL